MHLRTGGRWAKMRDHIVINFCIGVKVYSEMRGHVTGLLLLPNNYASMLAVAHARVRYKLGDRAHFCLSFSVGSVLVSLLFTLYQYILQCCLILDRWPTHREN